MQLNLVKNSRSRFCTLDNASFFFSFLFREIKWTREFFFSSSFHFNQSFYFLAVVRIIRATTSRLWTTARFVEGGRKGGEVWMDNRWRCCCSCKRPMFPLVSDKIDSICNCCGARVRVNAFSVNTNRRQPVIVINEPPPLHRFHLPFRWNPADNGAWSIFDAKLVPSRRNKFE